MSPKLLAATALTALLAGPAAFAAPEPQANVASGSPAAQAAPQSPWITVTSVEDLVGRNLRDPQGHDAGQIQSIVVDMRSGQVAYAVIESNGSFSLDGKYIAVPFSKLKLPPSSGVMNVMVPADKLAKSKHMSESDIADFGKPQEVASLYTYYNAKQPSDASAANATTAAAGDTQPYLLVRHDTIMQMNIGQHLASDVQGETVKDKSGKDVGTIDKIMVDPATGHIAYVLLTQGGFLGMGEDWQPMPAQALSWSAKDKVFVLNHDMPDTKTQGTLHKGSTPVQVRRAQLQALYERYGVKPYWS